MDEIDKVLTKAAALIKKNELSHGATARDRYGIHVASDNPRAVSYCALGAINKNTTDLQTYRDACDRLDTFLGKSPILWSDSSDKETVVKGLLAARTTVKKKTNG